MTAVVDSQRPGSHAEERRVPARPPVAAPRGASGSQPSAPGGVRRPASRRPEAELPPVRPRLTVPLAERRAVRRRRTGIAVLVMLGAAVVVVGLGLLGHTAKQPAVATGVVQVGPGESLDDVARRVAPGAERAVVVEGIRRLNGLSSSVVHPGQAIAVPGPG